MNEKFSGSEVFIVKVWPNGRTVFKATSMSAALAYRDNCGVSAEVFFDRQKVREERL